jgi:uncharacterized protein YutE (UPF0331/DUF86 family)
VLTSVIDPLTSTTVFWDLKASEVMKFISTLVTALAWPLSAFFIVNLFKSEIIERIPRLSELTLPGGISAKFNEGLAKVEAATEAARAEPTEARIGQAEDDDVVGAAGVMSEAVTASVASAPNDEVALRANPTGVVMEAWKSLEQVLRQAAVAIGQPANLRFPASVVVKALRNASFISHEEEASLLEMIELRNLVAHVADKTVTEVEAQRFMNLARLFTGKLVARIVKQKAKSSDFSPVSASEP